MLHENCFELPLMRLLHGCTSLLQKLTFIEETCARIIFHQLLSIRLIICAFPDNVNLEICSKLASGKRKSGVYLVVQRLSMVLFIFCFHFDSVIHYIRRLQLVVCTNVQSFCWLKNSEVGKRAYCLCAVL